MARRKGFSWKRATEITNAKRSIARATGIPTTKSGRKQKAKRLLTGRTSRKNAGCATLLMIVGLLLLILTTFFIL
ncbi:hypothetical protein D3C76_1778130 [compost metagenome]